MPPYTISTQVDIVDSSLVELLIFEQGDDSNGVFTENSEGRVKGQACELSWDDVGGLAEFDEMNLIFFVDFGESLELHSLFLVHDFAVEDDGWFGGKHGIRIFFILLYFLF